MVAKVLLKEKNGYHKIDRWWKGKVPLRGGDKGRGVYILGGPLPSFLLFNIEPRGIHPDDGLSLFLGPLAAFNCGVCPEGLWYDTLVMMVPPHFWVSDV